MTSVAPADESDRRGKSTVRSSTPRGTFRSAGCSRTHRSAVLCAPVRHRCVGAILVDGRSVLLCHRSPDRAWFPDVWDIPGGHVEGDERGPDAIVRELREELGIVVSGVGDPFAVVESEAADLAMVVYRIDSWRGSPANLAPDEHDRIAWVDAAAVSSLPLADESYGELFTPALSPSSDSRALRRS